MGSEAKKREEEEEEEEAAGLRSLREESKKRWSVLWQKEERRCSELGEKRNAEEAATHPRGILLTMSFARAESTG